MCKRLVILFLFVGLTTHSQTSEISEKNKFLFDNVFFKAMKLKNLDDSKGALKAFKKCIEIDPLISTPYYEIARIYKKTGETVLAEKNIKEANRLSSKNKWYLYEYAQILFQNNKYQEAANQYKKLVKSDPKNQKNYFLLAETYIYQNNLKEAAKIYSLYQEINGIDKVVTIQMYKIYMQLFDKKKAINILKNYLDKNDDDIELLQMLAETYFLSDQKENGFETLQKISKINPKNGTLHITLADYYRDSGENEKSFNELVLAFKSKDLNVETKATVLASYFSLIELSEEIKNQAFQLAKILIDIHHDDYISYAMYADLLYSEKQYQKAKEQYFLSLELKKSNQEIWAQILFIQADQRKYLELQKTSSEALTFFPMNPLFYYFNALSNKWFKNYYQAIESLTTGVDFVVDNDLLLLEYYSSLGDTYNEIKEYGKSDNYFEQALKIDSNNVIVLNNYAYYLSLRGEKLEKAKKMSYKANSLEDNNGTYQDTYAWISYQQKNYLEAKEWINKAIENDGYKSAVILEHYGDILYKLGEIKNAVDQWRQALILDPESDSLKQKIKDKKIYE
tara:strand:- start:75223 stop:76920 length:1698 start_codon:yes stop_codon:yes gene_type:complete